MNSNPYQAKASAVASRVPSAAPQQGRPQTGGPSPKPYPMPTFTNQPGRGPGGVQSGPIGQQKPYVPSRQIQRQQQPGSPFWGGGMPFNQGRPQAPQAQGVDPRMQAMQQWLQGHQQQFGAESMSGYADQMRRMLQPQVQQPPFQRINLPGNLPPGGGEVYQTQGGSPNDPRFQPGGEWSGNRELNYNAALAIGDQQRAMQMAAQNAVGNNQPSAADAANERQWLRAMALRQQPNQRI